MSTIDPPEDTEAQKSKVLMEVLYRRANAIAHQYLTQPELNAELLSSIEQRKLIYQLRVHQVELEMQAEELRNTQERLEVQRARAVDLMDLAPISCCTLSADGRIRQANLAVAALLGVTRLGLNERLISDFIHPEDKDTYYFYRKSLRLDEPVKFCTLRLTPPDAPAVTVELRANLHRNDSGELQQQLVLCDGCHTPERPLSA